jgi:alpha-glucosidase
MPVVRHAWLVHPDAPEARRCARQYFLGPDLLAAPVVEPGHERVFVWVPPRSAWHHPFSRRRIEGGASGSWQDLPAPVGYPVLLVRAGSRLEDAALPEALAAVT